MKQQNGAALKCAMACLVVGAAAIAAIPPAGAQGSSASSANIAPALKCEDLTGWKIPDTTTIVTSVQEVPEAPPGTVQPLPPAPATVSVALPPNCRADGVIDQRVGVDGKSYAIGFAVALPDRWNGRFLYQGGGGLNGSIRPPLGSQAAGEVPALARGFAVVSTDSGHQGAVFDASFLKDQEAALNFANASVGKVTRAAKAIVARYYGQPARRSYFTGCSTGGREGMLASARYPEQFDGIVAGAPAMRTGHSNIGLAWANAAFSQIAPKDASGKPEPAKAFSAGDRKLVTNAVLDACDAKDGVKDGMIFDGKACQFDPAIFTCSGAKTDSCLVPQQVEALKKAFAGPKNSRGTQVYPAFPWDSGVAAEGVSIPGILTTGARSPVGPTSWESINVDQLEDGVATSGLERLTNTAYWTNLTSFFGHGGKILFYHGSSDPWFSALDTVNYYERMAADSGGMELVREKSSRVYLVPGMGHCSSGATLDRFDLLSAVVNWVEDGKTADSVVATGPAFPGRSRPLCAYPQHAQFKGQGDPESASSFECK